MNRESKEIGLESLECSLLFFSSKTLKRITNSTLSAETVTFVAGFDRAFALRDLIKTILGACELHMYTDCGSLVTHLDAHSMMKHPPDTGNKRIQIDLAMLQQAVSEGEIDSVRHIGTDLNYANDLTKKVSKSILEEAGHGGEIVIPYYK